MSVSLEKIDMLMERANISYKEAKEALERHNGDMVEALIYLEASQKTNSGQKKSAPRPRPNPSNRRDFFEDINAFFKKMHKTTFSIHKNEHRAVDLPLTIAALIIFFTLPVSIFVILATLILGYRIRITDEKGKKFNFENPFEGSPKQNTQAPEAEKESEDRRF